eukprot:jgi/Galph1/5070/GphlegSOOS_G3759.1
MEKQTGMNFESFFTISPPTETLELKPENLVFLLKRGHWKSVYNLAERQLSGVVDSSEQRLFYGCLMLASLLKLGKGDQAYKMMTHWQEQYGWKTELVEETTEPQVFWLQYCLLVAEASYRRNTNLSVNDRLQSFFQLRNRIILRQSSQEDSRWSVLLNCLDSCIVGHLIETGKVEAAIELTNQCIARQEGDVSCRLAYFRLLLYSGDLKGAEQYFANLEPDMTDDAEKHLHRGLLYAAKGGQEALDEWEAASLFVQPYTVTLANNMAVAYLSQGRISEAMEVMENILRNDPVNAFEEDLIDNLCILYDMTLVDAMERKRFLQYSAMKYARDSFLLQNMHPRLHD